jgi:hypothetical protein
MTRSIRLVPFLSLVLMLNSISSASEETAEKSLENVPLTLFQLVARSDLLVHVQTIDGAGRFAVVKVLEVFKGEPPASQLRIDFRDYNLSLHGQAFISFHAGDQDLLFLGRKSWRKPSPKKADIFNLFHGRSGRIALPAEGAEVYLQAAREFAAVSQQAPEAQVEALSQFIGSRNPFLREGAMEELLRLRALTSSDFPQLVSCLKDPAPSTRLLSLRLIDSIFKGAGEGLEGEVSLALASVLERAHGDGDETVRAAAVRILGDWPGVTRIKADLTSIAEHDPSQSVRYEAERILFRMAH